MTEGDNGDLLTNKQYFVSYYEPISDEIDTESRPDIIKGAQSQLEGNYHIHTGGHTCHDCAEKLEYSD